MPLTPISLTSLASTATYLDAESYTNVPPSGSYYHGHGGWPMSNDRFVTVGYESATDVAKTDGAAIIVSGGAWGVSLWRWDSSDDSVHLLDVYAAVGGRDASATYTVQFIVDRPDADTLTIKWGRQNQTGSNANTTIVCAGEVTVDSSGDTITEDWRATSSGHQYSGSGTTSTIFAMRPSGVIEFVSVLNANADLYLGKIDGGTVTSTTFNCVTDGGDTAGYTFRSAQTNIWTDTAGDVYLSAGSANGAGTVWNRHSGAKDGTTWSESTVVSGAGSLSGGESILAGGGHPDRFGGVPIFGYTSGGDNQAGGVDGSNYDDATGFGGFIGDYIDDPDAGVWLTHVYWTVSAGGEALMTTVDVSPYTVSPTLREYLPDGTEWNAWRYGASRIVWDYMFPITHDHTRFLAARSAVPFTVTVLGQDDEYFYPAGGRWWVGVAGWG